MFGPTIIPPSTVGLNNEFRRVVSPLITDTRPPSISLRIPTKLELTTQYNASWETLYTINQEVKITFISARTSPLSKSISAPVAVRAQYLLRLIMLTLSGRDELSWKYPNITEPYWSNARSIKSQLMGVQAIVWLSCPVGIPKVTSWLFKNNQCDVVWILYWWIWVPQFVRVSVLTLNLSEAAPHSASSGPGPLIIIRFNLNYASWTVAVAVTNRGIIVVYSMCVVS